MGRPRQNTGRAGLSATTPAQKALLPWPHRGIRFNPWRKV